MFYLMLKTELPQITYMKKLASYNFDFDNFELS